MTKSRSRTKIFKRTVILILNKITFVQPDSSESVILRISVFHLKPKQPFFFLSESNKRVANHITKTHNVLTITSVSTVRLFAELYHETELEVCTSVKFTSFYRETLLVNVVFALVVKNVVDHGKVRPDCSCSYFVTLVHVFC